MNATQTTGTNLAILTVNSNLTPMLVIDPGSHNKIGKIIQSLKAKRQGFQFRVEDTTLSIRGKIYDLIPSLIARGYHVEETEAHRNREAVIAQRRAIAAIPPMGYASKRFSFRPHPLGCRVTFADKRAFVNWADGHGIEYDHLGRHHAVIGHLPVGCTLKYDRTPKCPMCCPAPPEPPAGELELTAAPTGPDSTWTISQLRGYCIDHGISVIGLSKKSQFLAAIGG